MADIWWCLLGAAVPQVNSSRIVIAMEDIWWSLLGAAVPAIIAAHTIRVKRRRAEEQRLKSARGREKHSDEIFVCMRVCTSKRMLKKVGAFSKDPILDTCVTVCGVSELDACADACARTSWLLFIGVPIASVICIVEVECSLL
ncbi:unnamed protein product [Musa banksii]